MALVKIDPTEYDELIADKTQSGENRVAWAGLKEVEAVLPDYVRALKTRGYGVYEDIVFLWEAIDRLTSGAKLNHLTLGMKFRQLRDIYSDRNLGGNRRTSGHGNFEKECQQRGYKPRTVRDLIADYEAFLSGKPSAAEKRKARQKRTPTQSLMQAVDRIVDLAESLQSLDNLSPDEVTKCEASVKVFIDTIARAKESSCQRTPLEWPEGVLVTRSRAG